MKTTADSNVLCNHTDKWFFVGNVSCFFSTPQGGHTRFGRPVNYVRTQPSGDRPVGPSPHTFRVNLSGPYYIHALAVLGFLTESKIKKRLKRTLQRGNRL